MELSRSQELGLAGPLAAQILSEACFELTMRLRVLTPCHIFLSKPISPGGVRKTAYIILAEALEITRDYDPPPDLGRRKQDKHK
jgi:hypothetical protein